ncbi:hypothetical protein CHS0354_033591 [Potamilus streckersoni]|uniref:Cyclin-dependent kinases regulatory subunit n=1 Tax=Potamilus streckersoni TaxID=2493646 RepID=A0AAE0W5R9_9BIVA|nr:hypothetical protein CHS0354_033591 [Potamilus streckersoni]
MAMLINELLKFHRVQHEPIPKHIHWALGPGDICGINGYSERKRERLCPPENIQPLLHPFSEVELARQQKEKLPKMSHKQIYYSDKYTDDKYEYRHVMLPKDIAKLVPKNHLMSETEWRSIGVQQSQGWIHYMKHEPEPHILLFRRPIDNNTNNNNNT